MSINEITNSEFLLPNSDESENTDDDKANNKNGTNGMSGNNSTILKKVLKCASDHSSVSFTDSAIDPEALNLQTNDNQNQNISVPVECKFSQLCLNYDTSTGDLVISFSHSCHL